MSLELTLTDKEAMVLRTILGKIGGSPTRSARREADSIAEKLGDYPRYPYSAGHGCIDFQNRPEAVPTPEPDYPVYR